MHLIIHAAVITDKESNSKPNELLHSAIKIPATLSFLLQCLSVRMGSYQVEAVGDDTGKAK